MSRTHKPRWLHRADDAQAAQAALQREKTELLARLEEVKRRVVMLVDKSVEDEEAMSHWRVKVRDTEDVVARLEAQLEAKKTDVESRRAARVEREGEGKELKKNWEHEVGILKREMEEVEAVYEGVTVAKS
jgi:chromosome segregation ATPase